MSSLSRAMALALSVVVAIGCQEVESPGVTGSVMRFEVEVPRIPQVDVLFVIDSAPGMAAHRDAVALGIAAIGRGLEDQRDLHVAVITSDVGTRGALDASGAAEAGCTSDGDGGAMRTSPRMTGRFLSVGPRIAGSAPARNFEGELHERLAELADVGSAGCRVRRPLEAMRRALRDPDNAGFLREHAYLAVVFVTNGDDCSYDHAAALGTAVPDEARCASRPEALIEVGEYVAALRELKRDPRQIRAMGAFGPPGPIEIVGGTVQPSCVVDQRTASPAVRLGAFVDQLEAGHHRSICEPELDRMATPIFDLYKRVLGFPCAPDLPADLDDATPGIQPSCAVWYELPAPHDPAQEVIPPCAPGDTRNCWRLELEADVCPAHIVLEHPRIDLPLDTHAWAECVASIEH